MPRPRLLEALCEGLSLDGVFARRLTLISAPAGFGKTTLAEAWVGRCRAIEPRLRVAWLSLDADDGDPALFMSHLRAALHVAAPSVAAETRAALEDEGPGGPKQTMTALLNELADLDVCLLLVLDDYHLAAGEAVDEALGLLVDYLPPRLHLALVSRALPDLPLPRLRARGQLAELRAEDLRFNETEAADFLGRRMKLSLGVEEMAALERRTEGWIAGLKLAALSIRGRPDPAAFIRSFTGSHRFVLDYLVEEVLLREPEEVRAFLLRTSILDQFCPSLCDAVALGDEAVLLAPGGGAREMLESLERANLFLVRLDDRGEWFRYHQLFADALRTRLAREEPAELAALHRRASSWYESEGFPEEAIRHALAGGDMEKAAAQIELCWNAMDSDYRSAAWLEWARRLPEETLRESPVLCAGYGWALLDSGELEASEGRFRDAENPPRGFLVADRAQYASLPSSIAAARAYRALAMGDLPEALAQAGKALALAPEGDDKRRMMATSLLGLARYAAGELSEAEEILIAGMAMARGAGRLQDSLGMTFLLADIRLALGRLRDAEAAYEEALRLMAGWGREAPAVAAELHRGMAELALERGELEVAEEEARLGRDLGEGALLTDWRYRLSLAEARIAEARGELDTALALLGEAERYHVRTPLPELRPVDAMRARLWIRRGEVGRALAWARGRGLSIEADPGYRGEYAASTLARALIARFGVDRDEATIESALALVNRLLSSAEAGGRRGSVIELLVLLALAKEAAGDPAAALAALGSALLLAENEGFAQVFLGEGRPLLRLLGRLVSSEATPPAKAYAARLLALGERGRAPSSPPPAPGGGQRPPLAPLSERELEVLRLLRGELSGPEIARELFISLNTLRTHTKNIFDKLDVNSRRAAVRRAEALGLG